MDTTGTTAASDQNELTFNQLTVPWRNKMEIENRKKSLNDILVSIDRKTETVDADVDDLLSPESNHFFMH
mgnify:CR=1 FL=1